MIYRTRTRPRVVSVSFATLVWLIEFQAAYQIIAPQAFTGGRDWFWRAWSPVRRYVRVETCARLLTTNPTRRFWPCQ